tara:strand:+ start:207 stop:1220 length:1014 start_codon:yes stop_codon:yes gene_type:complete
MDEEQQAPKKRGRKPLPPEEKQKRGRKKVVHQEIQERKNQGAPPLQISFICSSPEDTTPATALKTGASRPATSLNPFLENGAFATLAPVSNQQDDLGKQKNKAVTTTAVVSEKRMLLDESDDDELQDVRSRPRVDVSHLTGEKCITLLGAHTNIDEWPSSTDKACWNCTYEFDTIPIMLPGKYKTGRLHDCCGIFCSFNCARRYCAAQNTQKSWEQNQLLTWLAKKILGSSTIRIAPAPPFQALERFGGYLSIDEFRKDAISLPPTESMFDPNVRRDQIVLLQYHCIPLFQTVVHTHNNQLVSNSLREVAVRKENYDRTKPLPGSQHLATAMGIVRH